MNNRNEKAQSIKPIIDTRTPILRFPDFQEKSGWKKTRLSKISNPVSQKNKDDSVQNVLTLSSEYGLVAQQDYFNKKIAGESTERYISILKDDFVYNDRATKSFSYGTIKRLSQYESGLVSPIYKCFRFNEDQNPIFWEWYFESGLHEEYLFNLVNEGARTGRFNISIEKFLSIYVWQPNPREQQRIADCLSTIDTLITIQARKLDSLTAQKRGLMKLLFPSADEVNG